jgi:hypothetical protein
VQSFYSTQFVDRKETPEGGHKIVYTENYWLFFAVSMPLTLFTLVTWYIWSHFRRIIQLLTRERENHEAGLRERGKIMALITRRNELPH